ncbi:hypothetical protein [Brevibacillus fulvus]|uniref:Uncharacterized coiled-coil DUF342 family protein n=1 Tax=Brevibacillus fulvus TaxID=1125967 RepID=A0A939BR21_9BACL|nr:hypothetical protein [Brevibacillus fulvus]MBM7592215.1 uncharacterized coiled-coil DUF342 family protein [Brevibacillus fulvus]
MLITPTTEILNIQKEIKMLSAELEDASRQIREHHSLLEPMLADLNKLLDYQKKLTKLIQERQIMIGNLIIHELSKSESGAEDTFV